MSDHEWGPWIEHDQMHFPNEVRNRYIAIFSIRLSGTTVEDEGFMPAELPPAAMHCWTGGGWYSDKDYAMPILRYRIRKERNAKSLFEIADLTREPDKEEA